MVKVIALLAFAGAVTAFVLFRRRKEESWSPGLSSAEGSASSRSSTVLDEAGPAADAIVGAAGARSERLI